MFRNIGRPARLLLAVCIVLSLMPLPVYHAVASDLMTDLEDTPILVSGLKNFGSQLSAKGLSHFKELGQALPLAALAPGGADGLALDSVFVSLFDTLSASYLTYDDLRSALEALDGEIAGVTVAVGDVAVSRTGDIVQMSLTIAAVRSISPPLSFAQPPLDLDGGSLPILLTATLPLVFELNTQATNPDLAFYLVGEPALRLSVSADASIGDFDSLLGLTDIHVSGALQSNFSLLIQLVDPDANGQITIYDWSNAALIDLAQISYVDNPGAVQALQASLYLDSAIIPGDPDASLIFTIPNASLMLTPTVDLALSDLGNFTNLNPDDFLSGFAQLAAGLVGLQQAGDLKLPFLQQYLGDAFYFADPLIQFVQQQGVADVVCGSLNQIPPAGAVHNLPPGALVFCQAYALTNAQSVDWDIANGDLLAGETTTTTVGITPGSVVTFTLPTGGTPDVSVHFIDGDGVEHLALPRFDTLQELLPKLISLGGFDGDLLNPAYDSATQSLTYHLVKQWNPDPYDARLDFGDKLKAATHLSGLSQTNTASASFDPQDVVLDIVFGVILADGIDNPANRFFIQVPSGGHIFTADVNASAEIALKGQVGFVQVSVQGDAAQNTVNPAAAFTMGRSDSSRPMLSVDILSSEIMTASVVIPNAVLVSDLMRDVTIYVQPDCNVAMSAGLSASASLGSMEVTGGVAVSWPDAFAEGCTPDFSTLEVVPTADFSQNLFNFDLSPSLFGAYTNIITSTTLMVASDAAFLSAGRDLVGSTLKNLDDGSRCVITAFTDITLTCDSGLAGGTLNYWQTGDRYEIAGDPLAMLGAILDNLDLLTSALESLSGSSLGNGNFWQDDLPLVGFSPQELVTQFREIKTAVDEIRSGIPEGLIFCGDQDTLPPGGDVKNAAPGAIIYCQAFAPIEGDLSAATWSIVGGEPVANTSGAEALATVNNGTASANAAFRVTEAGGLDPENGFQVSLSFTDSGGVHSVFLPIQNPPPHLLKLEQLIESKLGIPAEALSFELGDAPLPDGSGNGERDLIIRLGYGICTEGDQPNVAIHPCAESDKKVTPPSIPINLQMPEPLAGLVGLEASFQLEYKAHAELDLAISLEASPVVAILGSTGVALEAGIAGTGISTQANIGPIALDLGATAILTGTHTDSVSNTTILTDTSASFILDGVTPDEDVVYNISDGSFCAVTAVSAHTLTCADGLSDDNAWDAGEGYRIGGSGVLRLAAAFTLKHKDVGGTLPETAAFTLGDFVGNLSASLGGIDDTSLPDCLAGGSSPDVCAALSMMANFGSVRTYLGTLTYSIPDLTEPYTMTFEGYQRLYDRVSNTTMNWVLLIRVLPELLTYVEENLDGAVSGVSLPLIGSALDAGADTAGALNTYVVTPLVTNLTPVLELLSGSAANVETTLEDEITTFLSDDPSLLQGDVNVTVYCSLDPLTSCVGSEPASAIQDLRVTFQVGQEATYELPFDLGIPGVPILGVNGALASHVGWHLLVDFGLNRNEGPYLVAHDRADGSVHPEDESELAVEAGVGLGANPVESCADYTPDQLNMPELSTPGMFSGERCVVGLLAFLQVMILDGEGDEGNEVNGKSHLTLSAGLDLTTDDDEELGRIAFTDLTSGSAGAALRLAADANVNLFLYTGLAEVEGFPSVAGVFHLDWQRGFVVGLDGSEVISRPLSIKFNYLYLDAGAFVNRFLIPITNEVKRITSPLMPVIDTVRAPLPVLSDLSRMTGGGDITLISLLELASNKDLTMIYRLMDFIVFANSLQPSGDHLWISLGGGSGGAFSLSAANATRAPPTPGQEDALIDTSAP